MANLLDIQEKLIGLIAAQVDEKQRVTSKSLLQARQAESLHWNDALLESFLEETVKATFGVSLYKRNIKTTMNGSSSAVGDLVIAIFLAIERQQRAGTLILGYGTAGAF